MEIHSGRLGYYVVHDSPSCIQQFLNCYSKLNDFYLTRFASGFSLCCCIKFIWSAINDQLLHCYFWIELWISVNHSMPLPMHCIFSEEYRIQGTLSHIWLTSRWDFLSVFDIPIELIITPLRIAFLFSKIQLYLMPVITEHSFTLIFVHRNFVYSQINFSNIQCLYWLFGVTFAAYW